MSMRTSNFELLRILAMLAIVLGHLVSQTGVADAYCGFERYGVELMGSGLRWAVNLFLLVGTWFMVDSEFKAERPLRLYLTVLFYSVPLTLLTCLCGFEVPAKELLRGLFPFFGRALWFASAYISLLLLSPFLRRVFLLPRRALGALTLLLTVLFGFVCTLPDPQPGYACDSLWFVYVYVFAGWLKGSRLVVWARSRRYLLLAAGLAVYSVLVAVHCWGGNALVRLSTQYLLDFKTLPNFFSAVCVFLFFANLDIGSIRWVNGLARSSFAVYVFHQVPAFIPLLWWRICRVDAWIGSHLFTLLALGVAVAVYAVASVIEALRLRWVEPTYRTSGWFRGLCRRVDGWLKEE